MAGVVVLQLMLDVTKLHGRAHSLRASKSYLSYVLYPPSRQSSDTVIRAGIRAFSGGYRVSLCLVGNVLESVPRDVRTGSVRL